jgi:hypothetical protein
MRVVCSVMIVAALLGTGCNGNNDHSSDSGDSAKWQTITAGDNSYTVSMLGQPTPVVQSVDVPQGQIHFHMQELISKHVNYTVAYTEYPDGFLASIGPNADAMFDQGRDATVKQRNAKVTGDEKGTVAGFPSRTLTMHFAMPENSSDATMRQVLILAKGRMYIVQTLVLSGSPASASKSATRFHQSFVLNVK